MSAWGTVTAKQLREALAKAKVTDLAAVADDHELEIEIDELLYHSCPWCNDDGDAAPQHDDFALDAFMSAAIGGDHRTAAAIAGRVFTDSNLDTVERHLMHAHG